MRIRKQLSPLLFRSILIMFLNIVVPISVTTKINAQTGFDDIAGPQLNSINLHLLGDGSILSSTYERLIPLKKSIDISARGGLGYTKEFQVCVFGPCQFSAVPARLTLVHSLTTNLGGPRFYFEAGLGANFIVDPEGNLYLPYVSGGIRWNTFGVLPFVIRAYFNYGFFDSNQIIYAFVPLGLSIGFRF